MSTSVRADYIPNVVTSFFGYLFIEPMNSSRLRVARSRQVEAAFPWPAN